MRTNLTRIGEKARKEPTLVFTSLYHHVTELDNLRSCYDEIDGRKAIGVDGVTIDGHLGYYAITDNLQTCDTYVYQATRILFKWLNRKSQRRAYTWKRFNDAIRWIGWPRLRIRKDLNPFRRPEALLIVV